MHLPRPVVRSQVLHDGPYRSEPGAASNAYYVSCGPMVDGHRPEWLADADEVPHREAAHQRSRDQTVRAGPYMKVERPVCPGGVGYRVRTPHPRVVRRLKVHV